MTAQISLIDTFCKYYQTPVYQTVKNETWGHNSINIASALTIEQLNQFCNWFSVSSEINILDVCCGVGETTKYVAEKTKGNAFGIDINTRAIHAANTLAEQSELNLTFTEADIRNPLPFMDAHFDAIIFLEGIIYFNEQERIAILRECNRILKPNGKLIYTDPCVIFSILSDTELATRSMFGGYYFSPVGAQESLFEQSGFHLIQSEDITKNNYEAVHKRWWTSREKNKRALQALESADEFECVNNFVKMCSHLYHSDHGRRKLSQHAFYLTKA